MDKVTEKFWERHDELKERRPERFYVKMREALLKRAESACCEVKLARWRWLRKGAITQPPDPAGL